MTAIFNFKLRGPKKIKMPSEFSLKIAFNVNNNSTFHAKNVYQSAIKLNI